MGAIAAGDWLTSDRVRRIAALSAIGGIAMLVAAWALRDGTVGPYGLPVGGDFTAFWAAGHLASVGDPAAAWDQRLLNAFIMRFHGVEFGTAWIYPPPFLLVAAPLGALPYLPALALFQAISLLAIAATLKLILGHRRETLVALASPLVLIVLPQGQNALLTAALLGTGLALLGTRPMIAGSAFGAMIYKPQLGLVLIPFLLLNRAWRAIAAASAAAIALIVVATLAFGLDSWTAFLDSLRFGRFYMEQGSVGFHKSASLFAAARLWGGSVVLAYGVQAVGLALGLILLWRTRASAWNVRAAATATAVAAATPYLLDYDLAVLGIGAAFLYREGRDAGFLPYEKSALALVWGVGWFIRPIAEYAHVPLGPAAMLLVGWLAWRRASTAANATASPSRR